MPQQRNIPTAGASVAGARARARATMGTAAILAASSFAGAAIARGAKATSSSGGHAPHGDASSPHWTYGGKGGPKEWGSLSPAFSICRTGADQSPIDLRGAAPGEGDRLRFEYLPTPLSLLNNGHTVQVDAARGSYFENGRGRYELAQFHFHGPSEHTVDGKAFPLEAHFVHKRVDAGFEGALAVVGVLFKIGARHPVFDAVLQNAPASGASGTVAGLSLDASALLPRNGGYFYYPGSLTTPPCSEGVAWHVLKTPLEISRQQAEAFRRLFKGGNARPVQPLRDRVLREM